MDPEKKKTDTLTQYTIFDRFKELGIEIAQDPPATPEDEPYTSGTLIQTGPPLPEVSIGQDVETFIQNGFHIDKDRLNDYYRDYLDVYDPCTEARPEYVLTALLSSIGSAIGKNRHLTHGASIIYPNIWSAIIGPSGIMKKSTALKIASKPVASYEGEAESTAILPVVSSQSAFFRALTETDHGLLVQDEFATLLTQLRNEPQMKSTFTTMYGVPETIRVSFIKSEAELTLKKPIFSIVAASTPAWLEYYTIKEDYVSGFLARFLLCCLSESVKRLPYPPPPDAKKLEDINQRFHQLYEMTSMAISPSDDFKTVVESVYVQMSTIIEQNRQNPALCASLVRLQSDYFYKFAILEATLNNSATLTSEDGVRAAYLTAFFTAQAITFFEKVGSTKRSELEKRILSLIPSGGISKTDRHKALGGKITAAQLNPALDALVKAEVLSAEKETTSSKPRTVFCKYGG